MKAKGRTTSKLHVFFATCVFVLPASAFAQRNLTDIPDPDPEIERKSFQVADGFEVNLFAADPLLAKPIQMNFDAAGRLWVATSEVYPQIEPGQQANDKIIVLEDTDGDGRADKTTVFADGLLIPTGVEPDAVTPTKDGRLASSAYVANSTELLHLSDTDGDGRADSSRIVLSGFGTEDTHHIIHTFRWGHDGCLYFNQSIYIHSHIESPWGVRRLGGGGIWQYRPESWRLEVFCRGFVNPWGHHFDDWGQSFATDGAYGEGINYVFPGATFVTAPGAVRILKGLNPGSPKHCGLEIVGGRHLPDDWQGNMLTNDFRGNRVCRFVVTEDGSGYASREMPELIKTSHVAFRPIDIKMGPDGAIYIADWYNPIIQHGEVDFRDSRRDHTRGRIWRVTAKGRPLVERPKLVGVSVQELLEHLKSPEPWTRHFAKRVLKTRGSDEVMNVLQSWRRLDERANDPHIQLETLWTLQSLGEVDAEVLKRLLHSPNPRVRAAATRVLADWRSRPDDLLDLLAALVTDEHPRVRLEAVRTLSRIQQPRAAELAAQALDRPTDQFLDFALWQTMRDLESQWLPTAQRANRLDEMGLGADPKKLIFALQAINSPAVVRPLVGLLREGKVPAENEMSVLSLIASQGGPAELGLVLDLAVANDDTPASRRLALLESLMQATRQRKVQPDGDRTRLAKLLNAADAPWLQSAACRAVGLWKVEPLRDQIEALANVGENRSPDPAHSPRESHDAVRQAAIDGLALLGGDASRKSLGQLCDAAQPIAVRRMAVAALATFDVPLGAARAADVLADATTDADAAEVFRSFLERKAGPASLAAALAERRVPADVAKIGIRLASISGREQPELVAALTKAGDLDTGPKKFTPEEIQQMANEVVELGNAKRGESIFRRKGLDCFKCHAIAGAGGQVGPDLVSIGASAPIDYLIDSLLEPGKQIKEGYHSLVVATRDGRVLTGIKLREAGGELVIRDAENREIAVPACDIEEQKPGGSLMPTGLADPLTRGELLDLVRFLSLLGKTDGPFPVRTARIARRWETLDNMPENIEQIRRAGPSAVARGDLKLRWTPVFSKVSGELPLAELSAVKIGYQSSTSAFARCHLNVTTAGRVRLAVTPIDGLRLWIDETTLESSGDITLDLSVGTHTLTFAVDATRKNSLNCELHDVTGSAAQVQFINQR